MKIRKILWVLLGVLLVGLGVFFCVNKAVSKGTAGKLPAPVPAEKAAELEQAWEALMKFIQTDDGSGLTEVRNMVHGTHIHVRSNYGGCCMDGDTLWVYLTEDDGSFEPYFQEYTCAKKKLAEHSWEELQTSMEYFVREYSDLYDRFQTGKGACPDVFDNIRYAMPDEYNNCIRIGVKTYSRKWEERFRSVFDRKEYKGFVFSPVKGDYPVISFSEPDSYAQGGVSLLLPEHGGFYERGVWLGYYK